MTSAITTQTLDISIKAEVLNGTWQTYGTETAIEVLPESENHSWNEWGCDKASFVLRRNPWAAWPDLREFTPVEIEIGGVIVWEGRINGTLWKAGSEQQISVQCEGWQYHLDDDLYKRTYVHSTLTDWRDARTYPTAPLAVLPASGSVQSEAGIVTVGLPKGTTIATGTAAAVILDLGQENAGVTFAMAFENAGATSGYEFFVTGLSLPSEIMSGGENLLLLNPESATSPQVATWAKGWRYVAIGLYRSGGEVTEAADRLVKITAASAFTETAYEGGSEANAWSVLRASTVIEDALARGTQLLSSDLSQINPFAGTSQPSLEDDFDILALVMANQKSPREMIEVVNAFHNWVTRIDLSRRMVFEPLPSEPELEFGSWSGEEVNDSSAGEGSEIFDRVIAEGTSASDEPLDVESTGTANIVAERGFHRAKAIAVANAMTTGVGERLAQVYREAHEETPFAGSVVVTPGSLRKVIGGQPVHPSLLARYTMQQLRISHMIDPNTGGVGRDGRMVSGSYTHATQSAEISLNARTENFDALLERLAVAESVSS